MFWSRGTLKYETILLVIWKENDLFIWPETPLKVSMELLSELLSLFMDYFRTISVYIDVAFSHVYRIIIIIIIRVYKL